MKSNLRYCLKQVALAVFCLSLLTRMAIPAGYMPVAIGDGWPIVLCPHGLPHEMFGGHHQHHDSGGKEANPLWDSCSFGASSAVYDIGDPQSLQLAAPGNVATPPAFSASIATRAVLSFQSRAPPAINS